VSDLEFSLKVIIIAAVCWAIYHFLLMVGTR